MSTRTTEKTEQRSGCTLSRPALFLLFKVRAGGQKHFGFAWPVPAFLLPGLAEMALDVFDFLSIFPGFRRGGAKTAHEIVRCAHAVLREIMRIESSYTLLDVDTPGATVRLRVV